MLNSPLGGRRGIGFGLGRSWQRKSADWWLAGGIPAANCIAAYQPIGAASYATSLVNLNNPGTDNITELDAPGWDATNGWKFATSGDKLALSKTITQYISFIVRLNIIQNNSVPTIYSSSGIPHLYARYTDNNAYFRGYNSTGALKAVTLGSYVMCVIPGGGYLDGVSVGTYSYSLRDINNLYIGGNATVTWIGNIQALALYYGILTTDEVSALTTAMQLL